MDDDTKATLKAARKQIARWQKAVELLEGRASKGSMPAARRKKIAAAQKKRWAKVRAEAKAKA